MPSEIDRKLYGALYGPTAGDRIRLAGEGEMGELGGSPGDLYVQVHVREHAIFTRDDSHLDELEAAGATQVLPEAVEASLMIAGQLLLFCPLKLFASPELGTNGPSVSVR